MIGFGWGFLAVAALTALVYALAIRVRLPQPRVEQHIEDTRAESRDEDRALAASA